MTTKMDDGAASGSSSSLAGDDGCHWVAEESGPKVGLAGSTSSGHNGGASNSPGKGKSSETSAAAVGSRYNEAAGSNGGGGGPATRADNGSLVGSELASSSSMSLGMSGNSLASNNGKPSYSKSSYSKIFLQYLPYTLNLNTNKRAAATGGGQLDGEQKQQRQQQQRQRSECDARGASENQLVCDTVDSNQPPLKPSRGIVGALSRFKISSSSSSASHLHQREQLNRQKSHNKQVGIHRGGREEEEEALFSGSERSDRLDDTRDAKTPVKGSTNRKQQQQQQLDNDNCQLIQLYSQNTQGNFEPVASKEVSQKVKRKGFLYLKRNNNNNFAPTTTNCGPQIGQERQNKTTCAANSTSRVLEEQLQKGSRLKRRDLNNNSISNLLGSSSHQKRDEEHVRCLLDCQEDDDGDEERDPQETNQTLVTISGTSDSNNNNNNRPQQAFEASDSKTGGSTMLRNIYESQSNNNTMSSKYTRKSARATAGGDPTKALMLASGLTLIGLCALALTGALAQQQQQQQPFSRSQRGPGGSPLSAAPLPPQAGGGSGPPSSAQVGGPGSGSRPAPQPAAGSLVANINCNKIKGHVTLTPNLQGGTTVTTQISAGPPGEVYQWSVHQFPVKPGAAMCSCSPMILGSKLIDLSEMHGNLPSDQEFNVQSSLSLFGSESPVGHSLLLRGIKTGMVACATFLPTSRKSNYRAKFHTPISGSVTIFQTAFGTSFVSHLMYSNGTRRHSMHRFDLVKSEDDMVTTSLLGGVQLGGSMTAGSSRAESLALEQREHEHELTQCRRYAQGEPLFRNMSYQLAVSTENFGMRGRTAMVLPQIPFETFASVFVIVYSEVDPSEPMACAPLKFVKPKTAAAKFQSVSVQGSVLFSQDSPYDVTVARINLQLPNSDGHSYGIDELPMIIRRKSDTRVCPNIREIIYNPHHVEPSSVPPEGEATSDQYAVGDLSGKYGSLTGKASEKIQVNDYNLPLYGPISIVGRAMTIYSAEGVAIACSNVELTTPMTTAFATFDYGIQGQFIFRQPVNDCNGDTYVYIEVSKPVVPGGTAAAGASTTLGAASGGSGGQDRSVDHNWHIHVSPVDSGLDHLSTTDCAPAGPHFNPYNTSTSSIYSRDCSPFNVFRCELGDMSGKMFTIEIPPYRVKGAQEPDIGKFFGTDIDLPLCGPVSIVNRSVVVHGQDFGHQRLACSTVIEFKPRTS